MKTSTKYAPGKISLSFESKNAREEAEDFAYNHLCRFIEDRIVRVRFEPKGLRRVDLVVEVEMAYWEEVVRSIKAG